MNDYDLFAPYCVGKNGLVDSGCVSNKVVSHETVRVCVGVGGGQEMMGIIPHCLNTWIS